MDLKTVVILAHHAYIQRRVHRGYGGHSGLAVYDSFFAVHDPGDAEGLDRLAIRIKRPQLIAKHFAA